ncbi:MAG: putative LPS assembly protein LptD [Balneolales bacterium]
MTTHVAVYNYIRLCSGNAVLTGFVLLFLAFWNPAASQSDTISVPQPDTTAVETPDAPPSELFPGSMEQDGIGSGSQIQPEEGGDEIEFTASDSLIFVFNPEREARLYGHAEVRHPEGQLRAGQIELNLDHTLMSAQAGAEDDSLTEPILTRGSDEVRSQRIQYNYTTEKGKFNVARVNIDKGNLIGTQVKRTASHVVFVEDGIYSTCELDHPHFYIQARKMKVVNEDEVFFTNARLFILDIPYPMVFPFGFIPSRIQQNQSGLLEPTFAYQEQQRRGLGLQNIGWFQYFNDYLAGRISFDLFTSGTYFVNSRLDYALTDKYTGSITVGYSRDRGLESTDPDFFSNVQKNLQVTHNQTLSPYARLSGNIDLRTAEYNRRNSYDIEDRAEVTTSSRASYNYNHPENLFNLGVSANQRRNFDTDVTSLSGPDVTFSLRRFTPFQRSGPASDTRWYESFNIRYQNQLRSRFNFNPSDDSDVTFMEALFNPSLYRQATGNLRHYDAGFQQNIDASSSLLNSQFVNLTTSVSLSEYWYPHTIRQEFIPGGLDTTGTQLPGSVERSLERGFASARNFSTSASLGTTLYGISNMRIWKLQGFRHTMRPSLSFTYSPDFSDDFWGVYRDVQFNNAGDTRRYPIYEGSIIGGPGAGKQQSIGFSVSNIFETKHVERDSTGEVNENIIRIIESLTANISYNLAAEQYNLSDLNMSARTSLVPSVNINTNFQFSFYDRDDDGRRIDRYLWQDNNKVALLTNFRVNASTRFNGGEGQGLSFQGGSAPHYPRHYDPYDQSIFHPVDDAFNDVPIEPMVVPWSVNTSFQYSWQRTTTNDITRRATINNDLNIRVTPEWQLNTSLGYDFIGNQLTPSRFSITRNLHCWDLSFEWSPFGDFQFYMFRLTVRDSQIQSLFQKLPGLNNLERSSSPINRGRSTF